MSPRACRRLRNPGSVLVTMNVHRQVAGLFIAEERGAHELKGLLSRSNSSALCAQAALGGGGAREHQRRSSAAMRSWACWRAAGRVQEEAKASLY